MASTAYWNKFRTRLSAETLKFGVEQIILICLSIATLLIQFGFGIVKRTDLTHALLSIVLPYVLYLTLFVIRLLLKVPKLIYEEKELELESARRELDMSRAEYKREFERLKQKPTRSAAEQFRFNQASTAIAAIGQKGIDALRYLQSQGKLTFGTYNPRMPNGLRPEEAQGIYITCADAGILTRQVNHGLGEMTFQIAPLMKEILDEILYPNSLEAG